jgi:hypothetical protein
MKSAWYSYNNRCNYGYAYKSNNNHYSNISSWGFLSKLICIISNIKCYIFQISWPRFNITQLLLITYHSLNIHLHQFCSLRNFLLGDSLFIISKLFKWVILIISPKTSHAVWVWLLWGSSIIFINKNLYGLPGNLLHWLNAIMLSW